LSFGGTNGERKTAASASAAGELNFRQYQRDAETD
jgi:hypothetical protein